MENDKLIDINEAAELLCTTRDFLYHNHQRLPFTVKLSARQLRFSLQGIYKYIEEKRGASRISVQTE